jgi:hypothetical protein
VDKAAFYRKFKSALLNWNIRHFFAANPNKFILKLSLTQQKPLFTAFLAEETFGILNAYLIKINYLQRSAELFMNKSFTLFILFFRPYTLLMQKHSIRKPPSY